MHCLNIDHVFRKAGIMQFSEESHFKVRARIIKVLCTMNAELKSINQDKDEDEDGEESEENGRGFSTKEFGNKSLKTREEHDETDYFSVDENLNFDDDSND